MRSAGTARDYYDVLGVPRTADDVTVRRAYLRLARELHPDVSDEPEERFQELTAAYRVLSDRASRLLYDRFGYRGSGAFAGSRRSGNAPVLAELDVDAFEAARGTRRKVRYSSTTACEACGGSGAAAHCTTCGGTRTHARTATLRTGRWLRVEPCTDCRCPECGGTGSRAHEEVLNVRLPAGVEDGTRLRVVGNPEDEHLLVQVRPLPEDPAFTRVLAAVLLLCSVALLAYFLSL